MPLYPPHTPPSRGYLLTVPQHPHHTRIRYTSMEIPPKGRYTRSTGTGRGLYGGVGLGDSVVALYTPCTGIHTQPPGLPAGTTPIHTLRRWNTRKY